MVHQLLLETKRELGAETSALATFSDVLQSERAKAPEWFNDDTNLIASMSSALDTKVLRSPDRDLRSTDSCFCKRAFWRVVLGARQALQCPFAAAPCGQASFAITKRAFARRPVGEPLSRVVHFGVMTACDVGLACESEGDSGAASGVDGGGEQAPRSEARRASNAASGTSWPRFPDA
eukprot:3307853-Rhodomonas_salina.1